MKYKKIVLILFIIITAVIATVYFNFKNISMKVVGHSMNNDEHSSMSKDNLNSDNKSDSDNKNSVFNNLEISNKSADSNSADDLPNINTPPKKKEPELTNVTFIDYVVNPTDTLWKITRHFMPNYPIEDTDDTIGIITYIAERNKLKKGTDGTYKIYYGQKLNIPAQLNIVSDVIKPSNGNKTNTSNTNVTSSNKKVSTPNSSSPSTPKVNNNSMPMDMPMDMPMNN